MLAYPIPWMDEAACATTDPDLWFPPKGGEVQSAIRICGTCPVQSDCLNYAVANGFRHGTWGGRSQRNLRLIRKEAGLPDLPESDF